MTPPRLDPSALMAELARTGRDRCVLCGRPPFRLGVWVPTAGYSRSLGAPQGKTRVVAYTLCRRCDGRPGSLKRAEDKILADSAASLSRPDAN
jgi:hypothetical protein